MTQRILIRLALLLCVVGGFSNSVFAHRPDGVSDVKSSIHDMMAGYTRDTVHFNVTVQASKDTTPGLYYLTVRLNIPTTYTIIVNEDGSVEGSDISDIQVSSPGDWIFEIDGPETIQKPVFTWRLVDHFIWNWSWFGVLFFHTRTEGDNYPVPINLSLIPKRKIPAPPQSEAGDGGDACQGMARPGLNLLGASVEIADTPLTYHVPLGPVPQFSVYYNQLSNNTRPDRAPVPVAAAPSAAASSVEAPGFGIDGWPVALKTVMARSTDIFSNVGPSWYLRHCSFVTGGVADGGSTARYYRPGLGMEEYTGYVTSGQTNLLDTRLQQASYSANLISGATLIFDRISTAKYERHLPDGSVEIYARSILTSDQGLVFVLTEERDPQGNSLKYVYDESNPSMARLLKVVDAIGQESNFYYDDPAFPLRVSRIQDPFGRTASYAYDANGRLASIKDPVGIVSRFAYDDTDFINKLSTPYGDTLFSRTEGQGFRLLEVTEADGSQRRVEYYDQMDSSIQPAAEALVPVGYGVLIDNNNLNRHVSCYWSRKAMVEAVKAGNQPFTAAFYQKAVQTRWTDLGQGGQPQMIPASIKNPLESRQWYTYAAPDGTLFNNIIDASNTLAKPVSISRLLDNGVSQVSVFAYNGIGKTTKRVDTLGRCTEYSYADNNIDLLSVRQTTSGSNDLLASYTWNSQHLPLTVTDAAGQTSTYSYNSAGQPLTFTNAKGETTAMAYDNLGYLKSVTRALPAALTSFTYDNSGRVRTVSTPSTDTGGSYSLTYDYDNLDRLTKVTYPDGSFEQNTYQRLDLVQSRDRLGRITQRGYNALGQVIQVIDPENRTINLDYCRCGAVKLLTDANGNKTVWNYDVQGRKTRKIYADGKTIDYAYESNTSRLKTVTDARGVRANYSYFDDNHLAQVTYTDSSGSTLNPATVAVNFTYDAAYGRLASMTDGTGGIAYAYYPAGVLGALRLAAESKTGNSGFASYVISLTYDELGRNLNRAIDGDANSSWVVYDVLGRVTSESNPLGQFAYAYAGATGKLANVNYPNGQKINYNYFDNNGDQRLAEIENLLPGNVTLSKFDYGYNAVGNITTWTRQKDNDPAHVWLLDYDQTDQLTGLRDVTPGAPPVLNQTWSYNYDPAGNRLAVQIEPAGQAVQSESGSFNNLNQLLGLNGGTGRLKVAGYLDKMGTVTVNGQSAAVDSQNKFQTWVEARPGTNTISVQALDTQTPPRFSRKSWQVQVATASPRIMAYDANGNMTDNGAGQTYQWDAENRLVSIHQTNHTTTFVYDGLSRRVAEKLDGVLIKQWVWCGGAQPCEERDASNNVTKRFYAQGEYRYDLPSPNSNFPLYYSKDHLGSVRELTDSTGAVRARYEYDPYGKMTKLSGDLDATFGYTGHYYHAASGLNLTWFRAYDSGLGRWLSRDPIGENGGINLYGYVLCDPILKKDISGLDVRLENTNQVNGWHRRITVDTPTGPYSQSFGMKNTHDAWDSSIDASINTGEGRGAGSVYSDTDPVTNVIRTIKTTPEEDKMILEMLLHDLGKSYFYNPFTRSCRTYSESKFSAAAWMIRRKRGMEVYPNNDGLIQ